MWLQWGPVSLYTELLTVLDELSQEIRDVWFVVWNGKWLIALTLPHECAHAITLPTMKQVDPEMNQKYGVMSSSITISPLP